MTLVELRCKVRDCGKLLGEVVSAPAENDDLRWAGAVAVHVCPRHGGANGSVARWVEKRRRIGLPHDRVITRRWISWAELRPAIRQARCSGETQPYFL